MSIYKIVFSPTGGTQKAADFFTKAFCKESVSVDLTDSTFDFSDLCFTDTDVCIAAVPSYGGRVPQVAVTRLKQMAGNGAQAILIAVYGNRHYEDTLLELQDTLNAAGFRCAAAVAAVAEHSIMRQFAAGRPDNNDAEELAAFAEKIQQKIEAGKVSPDLTVPGNRPYREFGGVPMKPKAGQGCTKCGLCAAKCPVGAIPADHPLKTDENKCISCMRCVSICPGKARKVNKLILTVGAQKMKKVCSGYKKNELFLPDTNVPEAKRQKG